MENVPECSVVNTVKYFLKSMNVIYNDGFHSKDCPIVFLKVEIVQVFFL